MRQTKPMVKSSITLAPDLLRQVRQFCRKVDRPVASVIRLALIEYLEKHSDDSARITREEIVK